MSSGGSSGGGAGAGGSYGDWGQAIVGALSSFGGSALGAGSAKELLAEQQKWARKRFQSRYQSTVRDMIKAGLNPILAGEVGGGSVPSVPSAEPLRQDVGDRAISSARSAFEASLARRESLARGDRDIASAQRDAAERDYIGQRTISETMNQEGITPTIRANLEKMRSEITANSAKAWRDRQEGGRVSGWGFSIPGQARSIKEVEQALNSAAGLTR